ncbi:MAG: hypothetical protein A6D92_04330 [Symbiobacterium thermophilum]|uniref:Uncharacterized protein n=1 Tax=Symbiobacterium thermophilum TaxID=2734 RepID=A0A1Y2T5J0_SYMTR|nr:MAG: hypothetical protein A6D92_04330 [Symbiobacterium thermophilum]
MPQAKSRVSISRQFWESTATRSPRRTPCSSRKWAIRFAMRFHWSYVSRSGSACGSPNPARWARGITTSASRKGV